MFKLFSYIFLCFSALYAAAQDQFPHHPNGSFHRGEKLTFRVHYGFIDAGTAEMVVTEENRKIGERNTYHIVGTGKSNRFFDFLFRVRDRFESYIDEENHLPLVFIRRSNEGGYIIKQDQVFNHNNKTVSSNGKVYSVPDRVQDMLSAYYYARNYDLSDLQIGDTVKAPAFVDDENWVLMIRFIGRDTITTNLGTFACLKFNPVVQKGRIFKNESDMIVYITDDKNRIPIRGEARILVGSIQMDLASYENLANPVAKIKETDD
ncbi:MAG: DUF3108 domain-containing protein [Bacteroidetes bacterium]|nr:DUF3108 domain-containing protein [Bacteroidota bacterium]